VSGDRSFIRGQFPFLSRTIDGRPIVYLDSASTAPKPQCVIDAVTRVYREVTANVHRGVHAVSDEVTEAYEAARAEIASFIHASPDEIVFTRNTTEAINLVAGGLGLQPDDEVVITPLEHHSNYLPWRLRARAVTVDLDDEGLPEYGQVGERITARTRLCALAQVPNTTGVIAPAAEWARAAHERGVPVLVDASQSASHLPIDVRALDCDFLALSGHKLLGPSGIGALYGKRERLERLSLYQAGGGMVRYHGEDRFETQDPPQRFEAGTPNIEGAIGLAAAVSWLRGLGMPAVLDHSRGLGRRLVEGLRGLPGARIIAGSVPWDRRIGLAAFTVKAEGWSMEGLARTLCDRYGILVSGGYHCAHVLHHRLRLEGTLRVSTHVYTTENEVDAVIKALGELVG
jgi:cysteine desulfurase / selenocysteine lyase